ncbi:hypothetical protein BBU64B_F0018 (plasmid) [Borreliella burgdorferi 64b]|nr:hypothetical protein BBU64B_F0018 [Borreliella burgdorferi 64b]
MYFFSKLKISSILFSALLLDKSQPNTNKKANIVDNNEIENFLFINLFSLDFNN